MTDNWDSFVASLSEEVYPGHYSILLKALWTEAKGDWQHAHDMVDDLNSADAALVHAYFHRREGDLSNSDYWYRRANRARPAYSLEEERRVLVEYLLGEIT